MLNTERNTSYFVRKEYDVASSILAYLTRSVNKQILGPTWKIKIPNVSFRVKVKRTCVGGVRREAETS